MSKTKTENINLWEPYRFLSNQFTIHAKIFNLPIRNDYIELSSGVNHLPIPTILKETMKLELDEDFLYKQYTALDGFQAVKHAVKLYERFLYSKGNISLKADLEVCLTIGASQAADLALAYLYSLGKRKLLLVGMTYPLYITLGTQYGYYVSESRSELPNADMPTVAELLNDIEEIEPDVIVFSHPCNPSGEKYTEEDLDFIMQTLHTKNIFCIFDCVCNIIMSEKEVTVPEPHILKNKMMQKSIIINSFSKTESIPGFRIGYIAGDFDFIQFIRSKQVSLMNPPNFPTIAIWLTMLFRCLYLSEQYGQNEKERKKIVRCFRRIFHVTTVLCSQKVRNYVEELVELRLIDEYEKYKKEMIEQEHIFTANKDYIHKKLHPFLEKSTHMDTGFNSLFKLTPCHNIGELEFCEDLLIKTGIAVFTESGFSLKQANQNDYWIRLSLALPTERFKTAIDKLCLYLSNLNK